MSPFTPTVPVAPPSISRDDPSCCIVRMRCRSQERGGGERKRKKKNSKEERKDREIAITPPIPAVGQNVPSL